MITRLKPGFSQLVKDFAHSSARDKLVLMHPGKNVSLQDKPYSRQHSQVVRLVKGHIPGSRQELILQPVY